MNGDPKVMADIRARYLVAFPVQVEGTPVLAFEIQREWDRHVHGKLRGFQQTDAEIRAWEPPAAEPSLADRVAEIEERLSDFGMQLFEHRALISNLQHPASPIPEPTAPDDPVCARCGHTGSMHQPGYSCDGPGCDCVGFVSAPPAAQLDPVLVKIAELYELIVPSSQHGEEFWSSFADALRTRWEETELAVGNKHGDFELDAAIRAYGKAVQP